MIDSELVSTNFSTWNWHLFPAGLNSLENVTASIGRYINKIYKGYSKSVSLTNIIYVFSVMSIISGIAVFRVIHVAIHS
jgi:hypothetical protein